MQRRTGPSRGDVLPQVVAREAEVARLLGHVDLHDALAGAGGSRARSRSAVPLHVVDRVLAAEHEDEEQLGEAPRRSARPGGAPIRCHHGEARDVEAGAVHELLEHQRVLRLLDDLVVDVAELGRRRSAASSANSRRPRFSTLSNWSADLHEASRSCGARCARARPPAARGTRRCAPSDVVGAELPARIVGVDARTPGRPRRRRRRRRSASRPTGARAARRARVGVGRRRTALFLGQRRTVASEWHRGGGHGGLLLLSAQSLACGMSSAASAFSASTTWLDLGLVPPAADAREGEALEQREGEARRDVEERAAARRARGRGRGRCRSTIAAKLARSARRRAPRSSGSVRAATTSSSHAWNVGPRHHRPEEVDGRRVAVGARRQARRRRRGTPACRRSKRCSTALVTSSCLVGK